MNSNILYSLSWLPEAGLDYSKIMELEILYEEQGLDPEFAKDITVQYWRMMGGKKGKT